MCTPAVNAMTFKIIRVICQEYNPLLRNMACTKQSTEGAHLKKIEFKTGL